MKDVIQFLESLTDEEFLMHYGMPRRSGRYPWGSGENPFQHSGDFLSRVEELKAKGMSESEIAKAIGLKTTQLRVQISAAKHERKQLELDTIKSLQSDGLNTYEIGRKMGLPESTVRSRLNEASVDRLNKANATADILREVVNRKDFVDIGAGTEIELGCTKTKLQEAQYILEREGYNVYNIRVPQVTNPAKQTIVPVLCKPDAVYKDAYEARDNGMIESVADYHSADGGKTYQKLQYPASIDSKRVAIRYNEEGGLGKDGVMEIRRGCEDLSLGNSHYAQVRILVDGTHYLKGMAIYSDNLPKGVDIMFNTNKTLGTDKMKVLKEIKDDPDNPFGAAIKANGQSYYTGKDGKEHLSAINKIKEEGDWDTSRSKNLSSQFLGKQNDELIRRQLDLTYKNHIAEYDEICSLTNPTIKRKLLLDFADSCDTATSHLQAAALPRQKTQVLLPLTNIKDNEIYAPNFKNGEQVALVRYPHGGTFEIPVLTVNNKNKEGKSILGNVTDAVGIHSKVAERLSGADFDGDTAIVIPTNDRVKIRTSKPLEGLKNFDPKTQYSTEGKTGVKLMTKENVQKQMGMVSNLITDMTLKGANSKEIERAVRHSMVVIDAYKHKLDYKQSEKDNGIAELKKKYQGYTDLDGKERGGASTLLSRKKQEVQVNERKGSAIIDPVTGKVSYRESGRTYVDKNGKTVKAQTKVKLMDTVDDAHLLSSGTTQEKRYADYANKMKALANNARKEYLATERLTYSKEARKEYEHEVASLEAKLKIASLNAPRERRAQVIANSVVKAKQQENPDMDKKDLKKARQIAINNARAEVNSSGKDTRVTITDREWEAIQRGAITDTKLSSILRYTDSDVIRQRAMPKATNTLSPAQVAKVKAMLVSGHTYAEVAEAMGKSTSTIAAIAKE